MAGGAPIHIVILSHDFDLDRDDNKIFLCIDAAPLRPLEAGLVMEVRWCLRERRCPASGDPPAPPSARSRLLVLSSPARRRALQL